MIRNINFIIETSLKCLKKLIEPKKKYVIEHFASKKIVD